MKKSPVSVSRAEWGSAREEFVTRLPEILEQHNKGLSKKSIHENLTFAMSYSQFCRHLSKHLNSSSPSSVLCPPSQHGQSRIAAVHAESGASGLASAPVRVGKTGGFVMPAVDLDEGEDQ